MIPTANNKSAYTQLIDFGFTRDEISMLRQKGKKPEQILDEINYFLSNNLTTAGHAEETFKEANPELYEGDDFSNGSDIFSAFDFYCVPDLTEEERTPPDFIIDGLIPCGMTFLSGAPKTRKSFLALQLAIAVAKGEPIFNHNTLKCDVVYFDLEGSKSRTASRTERMTGDMPRNVYFTNSTKYKLSDGLPSAIRSLHLQMPQIRLFVIDTYSRARGYHKAGGANAYDDDVSFLEPIQRMATEEKIAILFVHHDKKGASMVSDSFERLSGTMGISGSADCVMNLTTEGKRFEGKAILEYNPRDMKGGELRLAFDELSLKWRETIETGEELTKNPVCNWVIRHIPEKGKEGAFYAYEDVFTQAFQCYSEKPGDIIRKQIENHRAELFSDYGAGIQMGVQSHGRRGIRVINLI